MTVSPDLVEEQLSDTERLDRIEAKVDRILGIMETVNTVLSQASQHPMLGAFLGG